LTVATSTVTLRPVEPEDYPLLRAVYASTREEELALVQWDVGQREEFLRQQFDAQDAYYRENYTDTSFDVIEVDGRAAGRLYVARWEDEIRIVDIALLPEFRGFGVGTELVSGLLDEAAAAGKRLSIHVEKFNRARALYERLGFTQTADRGVYVLMEAGGKP
jgi:ribosomal protein S18 acetylase RimI-like enzyme